MKRQNKKGFTIIELVIVIAVIAILASVLIPVFSNIVDKANVSKDTQLVRNLNSALKTDLEKHETMYDALQAAEEYGYDIDKINASATDNEILWDSKNDCFVYLNGGKIEYIPNTKTYNNVADHEYWMIANSIPATQKYSIYAGKNFTATDVTVSVGFDAGEKTGVNVNVVTDETIDLVIRANSVADTYKITAPDANIKFFGTAGEVDVVAVKDNSLHIYGAVEFLQVKAGRVVAENTAEIKGIHIADAAAKVVVESNAVVEVVTKETGVANVTVEGYTETIEEVDAETAKAGAKLFAAGNGTEALPFIIETVEQFKNINEVYESGYNYFKAAENAEFDATDLGRINLNGSFDGNGATFKNANGYIFATVGTCENAVDELPVVIKNFSVVFVDGMGVVRCCGAKTLTYENVNVLGYLLCDWNAGAFLRYGTANVHETGFDYTVNFVKCSSNAKIYSTSNAYSAILIGHTYPGAGKATINIDANTEANISGSKLYYTGTDKNPFGYKYCCIASNATIYVDGKETTNDKYYENIVLVPATNTLAKEDTGYVVDTAEDTTKLVVTINFQYTLYTDDTYATYVPKNNGVGGMLDTIIVLEVAANTTQNVFDLFESVEIVTGADEFDYEIKDGKLTIYVIADNDNIDGWVTLNVEQCTADSNIPTWKDSIRIAQRSAKNNPEAEWIVK